jgi:hypothetical protein
MKTYIIIGKFIGIWPRECSLLSWIVEKWKSKEHFDIQLRSTGFFIIIFTRLDDRDNLLEGGPYLFKSVDLYLRNWIELFHIEKEDFTWAPVWIRLYSFPQYY